MTEMDILHHIENGVLHITLNRPERLNSFNEAMHQQFSEVLRLAEREADIRALLITGAGRAFCAGQDLNDRNPATLTETPDLGYTLETFYNPLIRRLTELPKPVIAAVNGVAAGAGANLALACDIILAAQSASFIQAFSQIGLVPDSGGTWFLPRQIGRARALGLALLGEKITATQAHEWGLIWQVTEDEKLAEISQQLATQLAQKATYGLGLIKKAFALSATHTLPQQLDLERDLQRLAGRSEDYREGVSAFFEKRPARFSGR